MAGEGWLPGLTRRPEGMHAMMSLLHEASREDFLADLSRSLDKVRSGRSEAATVEATY